MSTTGPQSSRRKILVVDDERVIATTLAAILDQQGYETATAFSGEEAVELAARFQPDVLLSDVRMSGMNGVDAAIAIRGFLPHCAVLLVSGHASTVDVLGDARARGFYFELWPKPIAPAALLEKLRALLAGIPGAAPTILNVDDNDINRYAVTRMLTRFGFTVHEAESGAAAIELARSAKPDLVLLDIHLPDMSGFDVCDKLKSLPETAHIPIVHLTNTARDDESRAMALRLGASEYVTHPVDPDALFCLLRRLTRRAACAGAGANS